jgi:flagellar M-ring protein FliF
MAVEAATGLPAIMNWPLSRKISLAVAALLSIAIFAVIIIQARVADYRLLYANLASTDASAVIDWLKDQKIPFRIEDGGRAIEIPADKVYEARLNLAGAGLPQGGGVGFEIFDKQSFGMTDFTQKINYQRALQGELARTISSLAPVEAARVMLALPAKRLFKEQQKEATASVILKLTAGHQLSENQVQGIIHLVAGSIEGLTANNVNVIDSNGNVLSKKTADSDSSVMSPGMLDFQQAIERRLEERAQSLLDRALGAGNSQARVTAELDFSQVEKLEEIYDPKGTVPRSEQTSEEKSGTESVGGIPGSESNVGDAASGSTNNAPSSSTTETINYEVSKVVNKVVSPVGTIKKLSVAVLVADRFTPAPKEGQEGTFAPRSAEELLSIKNMITSALGLDKTRGDMIEVVSMPFEDALTGTEIVEPTPPEHSLYQYLPYAKYGLLVLATGLLYFLLVKPIIKSLATSGGRPAPQHFQTVRELENELAPEELLGPNDPTLRLRKQILASETSPTQVIKSWLNKA